MPMVILFLLSTLCLLVMLVISTRMPQRWRLRFGMLLAVVAGATIADLFTISEHFGHADTSALAHYFSYLSAVIVGAILGSSINTSKQE